MFSNGQDFLLFENTTIHYALLTKLLHQPIIVIFFYKLLKLKLLSK